MSGSHETNGGSPRDASSSVGEAVRSLDPRLDDLRREASWRAIEGVIDERPAITPAPPRTWRLPVFALATIAVVIALVVLPKPTRDGPSKAAPTATASPSPSMGANDPPTTLSASAGQRTVFERDGVILTLVGPSVATVHREVDVVRVSVTKGLVVADRTPTAPALAVDAGDNHVVSRDARFAVRVEPTMVVLGAGEQARQIVERHAIDMGALPLVEPPSTTVQSPTVERPAPIVERPATVVTKPERTSIVEKPRESRPPPILPDLRMDAAELYKRAEAALAVRDPAGAREFLERLVSEYPTDSRVDAARYDLALIARAFGQHERALELLDTLIASGTDETLKAAARRLRPTLTSR